MFESILDFGQPKKLYNPLSLGDFPFQDPLNQCGLLIYFILLAYRDLFSSNGFARDDHIPDLLLFSPQTQFHDDISYRMGKIILQDKASCFPSFVLNPPAGDDSVVIDATAAPGNKTSHLSALMRNKGKASPPIRRNEIRFNVALVIRFRKGSQTLLYFKDDVIQIRLQKCGTCKC